MPVFSVSYITVKREGGYYTFNKTIQYQICFYNTLILIIHILLPVEDGIQDYHTNEEYRPRGLEFDNNLFIYIFAAAKILDRKSVV